MMPRFVLPYAFTLAIVPLWASPAMAQSAGPAPASDRISKLCGWFDNPTPGNASLHDSRGEWTIGIQGGRQAEGDWPTFKPGQWIRRGNGSYGFGCACIRARIDESEKDVLAIVSSEARPLGACRRDKALSKVEQRLK